MKIKILFICHGNICRSPMAEFIFKDMIEKMDLKDSFLIESAATSSEECYMGYGNPIYPPARKELIRHRIGNTEYTDFTNKRARQITSKDYDSFDFILCADSMNIRNAKYILGEDKLDKIHLILDFTETPGRSISDPWYSGDFSKTYEDLEEGLNGFLKHLNLKQD